MFKKIINFVVVIIMVTGVFGLTACDNVSLDEYKATKSQALQDYADAKCEANSYCAEGLAAISAAVTDGKAEIDKATSVGGVDTAFKTATDAVDAVAKEEVGMGKFYTLLEAYDEGLLTVDDLQKIASHQNDGTIPVDVLSEGLLNTIKESWIEELHAQTHVEANTGDVIIIKYYGTYSGSVALMLADNFTEYGGDGDRIEIAGIPFIYSNLNRIIVYK